MILLAFLVDASFIVEGSCFTKVFLVPDPFVEPADLHGTPAVCKASSLFAPPPGGGLVLVAIQGRVPFRRHHTGDIFCCRTPKLFKKM